ncbi:MAG TPA: MFS transporter [Terriglobales bacterium]|nr:MFS transporter [Terriglobales bacterium]
MADTKLYPRTTLVVLTALNLVNYIDRSVLFAVQPMVQAEFHRRDSDFGLLSSAFFIVYMCTAPFMGPLADRYSRKKIIIAGAVVWSIATLLTAITYNFRTLFFRHVIVGIGEASFCTISPTVIADLFPERMRGRVLGFFYLTLPLGTALGYILGGTLSAHYNSWRAPFYIGAVPGILLALILVFLPEPERGRFDSIVETPERGTIVGLARNPAFWTATLGMAMMTFALGGLQVWMPTFLHRDHGYSLKDANLIFGLSTAGTGILAALAGGWLGDYLLRYTRKAYYLVSAVSLAMGIPAMWIALYANGHRMLAGVVAAEFLLLVNTSPLNAALINSVGAHVRATAIAVNIFVIHLLGDASSPWVIGYLSDHQSLGAGLFATIVAIALSVAILSYGMRFAPALGGAERKASSA